MRTPRSALPRVLLWLACGCALACAIEARAGDALERFKAALEKPNLPAGQSLHEVKAFVTPRIVPPPRAATRAEWEQTAARLRRDVLEQIVFRGRAAESARREVPRPVARHDCRRPRLPDSKVSL